MPPTSTVLTGVALATGIAREATDGVPVVKQILGVASRIVALGEQIDKNREDLRALSDRAKGIDATLAAVVADREIDDRLQRRLERVYGALRAIEKLFATSVERGRFRRLIWHIFTGPKEVARVQGVFEGCLEELALSASLNTNVIARENSRFIGEFRNVRDSEIHLLRRISHPRRSRLGYTVACHLATCEGSNHIFVVRTSVPSGHNEEALQCMNARHKALEEMSMIQNRHPALAYLYGRNIGPKYNRFIVLNTGYVKPLGELIRAGRIEVSVAGRMVSQLVDGLCHLRKHGLAWDCKSSDDLCLNDKYQPKLGVWDELSALSTSPELQAIEDSLMVRDILCLCGRSRSDAEECAFLNTDFMSARWLLSFFDELMDWGHLVWCSENVVDQIDIPALIPLNQESRMYLHIFDNSIGNLGPLWADVLLSLASGVRIWEGSILQAHYDPSDDAIDVMCVENNGKTIHHLETTFIIRPSAAKQVREQLGIALEDSGEARPGVFFHLRVALPQGATSVERSGWIRTKWGDTIENVEE